MSRARKRQRRFAGTAVVAALVIGLMAVAQPTLGGADGYESPGNPVAFRSLTAGHQHTCSLRPGGVVKCWGAGSTLGQGRLSGDAQGDEPGEMGSRLRSINLGAGRTATALTAGLNHTCALLDGGDVNLQNGSFGHAHLTGTVTSSVNGAPLVGIAVMAARSSDHRLVEGDRTDSFGRYDIEVDDGSYKLAFYANSTATLDADLEAW